MKSKECNDCRKIKPLDNFYTQKRVSPEGENYLYYRPDCIECTKKKVYKWREENPEQSSQLGKDRRALHGDEIRKYKRSYYRENKHKIMKTQKEWQDKNKGRISRYVYRGHDISDDEWYYCLEYFNFTCAYCEMSEENHYKEFGTQFHKEHVVHDGNNYIDNCVPSCKTCNSSKHDFEFNDWYNEDNPKFSKKRLAKIIEWTTKESLLL